MANNAACAIDSNIGKTGEQFVCDWLHSQGYVITIRNFRCKLGELDIIAQLHSVIAFVEVKTRKTDYFPLSEVITLTKQRKIIATAKWYLLQNKIGSKMIHRFDVALLHGEYPNYKISYVENAFTEPEY